MDMAIEHPEPTPATAKELYAHAFHCAYQGCRKPLYRVDDQTGDRTLNSRICHINARREGGPRWEVTQSGEENRSERNLVLMCLEHASEIDDNEAKYPADLLRQWKQRQINEYFQFKQGWIIDTEMARDAIDRSEGKVLIDHSTINLGGEGGRAPGAGGGGGGAIGRGSRGGRGGDGGDHRVQHDQFSTGNSPRIPPNAIQDFVTETGVPPGAGGGGAGAIGDGAIGGDGGGGGESVDAIIDLAPLRARGFDHIEVVVGQGGKPSSLPGHPATDGEDTVLNFISKDATILRTIRAKGGKSGSARLPDDVGELSPADLNGGFRITALMPVNAYDFRDGLFYILGGLWTKFLLPQIPREAIWQIVWAAEWETLEASTARGLFLSLINPIGKETSCQAITIPRDSINLGSTRWMGPIGALLDIEGRWRLRLHSGGFLLAQIAIEVAVATPATP
jgi:hypothetical protein